VVTDLPGTFGSASHESTLAEEHRNDMNLYMRIQGNA